MGEFGPWMPAQWALLMQCCAAGMGVDGKAPSWAGASKN